MMELTLKEIAEAVDGELIGSGSAPIRGVAPVDSAGPHDLSFIANARYLSYLQESQAGGLLVSSALASRVSERFARIVVDDPHIALYRILPRLYPKEEPTAGIDATACVHDTAEVATGASVGPFAVIGPRTHVGDRARIGAHAVIGADSSIGADTILYPHVTVYDRVRIGERCIVHSGARIGREGFGFVWADGGHRKVPQVGRCLIEDDVEIGNNATIDRGSLGDTVVGTGTKIDSMVHLGHNSRVGRHVFLAAQIGLAGSSRIGDGAIVGGQVGIGGHLVIGAGARIGAQAGVTTDVPAGETYSGYPARPHREALRAQGSLFRLPDLVRRIRALEKAIFGSRD